MIKSEENPKILVVDDELSMREFLEVLLTREGYNVSFAERGRDAVSMIKKNNYDLILSDIRLGDIDGLEVLRAAKQKNHNTVVILISAYATTETAVEAMNEGAYDFVPKPFDVNELKITIAGALDLKTLNREEKVIHEEMKDNLHFGLIVGNHSKMLRIYDMIRQVASTKTNILISGESGTGKESIARAIHEQSDRSDKPFEVVTCGSIPEQLIESELFGHKRGSFTGATNDKKGRFEIAHRGTIFLDEIGELSHPVQVKLLRAVQERVFRPVGETTDISVDIRIVSATNKLLDEEVIAGRFREDLFYRLNVIEIKVPPLRERKSDLRALAQYFLEIYSNEMGKKISKISSYAIDLLNNYEFPGNIRELENMIQRSVALSATNIILPESLSISNYKRRWVEGIKGKRFDIDDVTHGILLDDILQEIEIAYLKKALEYTNGNKNKAAKQVGISFRSMRYRLEKLGIE